MTQSRIDNDKQKIDRCGKKNFSIWVNDVAMTGENSADASCQLQRILELRIMKQVLFWLRTSTMADAREMAAKYKRQIFRYPQIAEGNNSKNTLCT